MEVTEATVAMKPWEQHHAIISMPRFAYNPMSVLQQTAGFLVTCTFREHPFFHPRHRDCDGCKCDTIEQNRCRIVKWKGSLYELVGSPLICLWTEVPTPNRHHHLPEVSIDQGLVWVDKRCLN